MNHTKKYLVVPYVQDLEKPSENNIHYSPINLS